jgi:hypothetical protein
MNKNKSKILFESWRAFLTERDTTPDEKATTKTATIAPADKPSVKGGKELEATLKEKDYMAFVQKLSQVTSDPEFQKALNYGLHDGDPNDEKVALNNISPKVTELKPTQNEIDMNGSLKFAVASVENLLDLLKDGEKSPGGNPIVTGADGKLVLDGHHRWSQVYCINPRATIKAVDLKIPGAGPMAYLKVMQLAIASNLKKVPVQTVKGTNLLDPSLTKVQLKEWLQTKTPQNVLTAAGQDPILGTAQSPLNLEIRKKIKSMGAKPINKQGLLGFGDQQAPEQKQEIQEATKTEEFPKKVIAVGVHLLTELIWHNILQMRQTSQPVKGAPKRDFMPQTDDAKKWKEIAASGQLNFGKNPMSNIAESLLKKQIKKIILKENKK